MGQRATVVGSDVTFEALTWGPADGALALLLHGYPDSPESWRGVAERLATEGYRVVAPWTRGYAPTSVPASGSFHIGALASDAIELHGLFGGDERAVLVGHDWGAVAAHAVAGLDTQPYRRIVTMAVPPAGAFLDRSGGTLPWLRRLGSQLRLSWYMAFQQLPVVSERALPVLVPRLWRRWSPGFEAGRERDAAWRAIGPRRSEALRYYRHAARAWTVPEQYREAQRGLFRPPRVPMRYLHGVQDGCVRPDWIGPSRAVLPPGCDVVEVAGAGHFLQAERPDEVAGHVIEFLGRADGAGTAQDNP